MIMITLLRREFTVDLPLEKAWEHLARVEQWPSWAKHVKQVEVHPAGDVGPQSTGIVYLANGIKSAFTMTEFNRPRNWKWIGRFLWLTVHYDHRFEELNPQQTRLIWVVEAKGFGVSVFGRLFAKVYNKNLEKAIPLLIEEMNAHSERPLWPQPEVRNQIVQTTRGPVDVLDAGHGWPILYFHGTGAGSDIVPAMEHTLVEDGFRLIVPNRPGYYGTPLSCGRTPNDCADLAAEVLDRLDIERAVVVGTSGGGLAAGSFAARHPAKTLALVLQCTVCHPFVSGRWMPARLRWLYPLFWYHRVCLPILRFGFRRQMRRLRRNPYDVMRNMSGTRHAEICDDPAARALAALLVESTLRCAQQPVGIENDWANMAGDPWLNPNFIRCPTLILHDRVDPLVPFAHAEWALDCIPGAKLCELHAGGHLIWTGQDTGRMREERAAFLRSHFERSKETTATP